MTTVVAGVSQACSVRGMGLSVPAIEAQGGTQLQGSVMGMTCNADSACGLANLFCTQGLPALPLAVTLCIACFNAIHARAHTTLRCC